MRVGYVGNFRPPYSTENDVREGLESLGHQVVQFQEDDCTFDQVTNGNNLDLLLWTSTWDHTEVGERIRDIVAWGRHCDVPTAAYHLDTFWNTDRSNRNWRANPMWKLDHVFTADGDHQAEFAAANINHHWLPAGVRPSACYPGTIQAEYVCDVAFVGADGHHTAYHPESWPYRAELTAKIIQICNRNGWTYKNPGGIDPKIDRGNDLNDFYASAKVVVGDSLCHAREDSHYWSDRVYETCGRGGLLVMPNIVALRTQIGCPRYQWGDWASLELTLRFWMDLPTARAERKRALLEQVKDRHTYAHRMKTLIDEVMS